MAVKPPIIAIVGRPNVGKSTLFNTILGARRAVVEDIPGVTRDRNYALVERYAIPFFIVDTGGFETDPEEPLQRMVAEQTVVAAEEADLVLALFDGKAGLQEGDREVVTLLRRFDKPVLYAVNKCDGAEQGSLVADFYALGIDHLFDVSALHNRGARELVETALASLPNYEGLLASAAAKRAQQKEAMYAAERRLALHAADEPDEDDEAAELPDEPEGFEWADDDAEVEEGLRFAPVLFPEEGVDESRYVREYGVRSLEEGEDVDRGTGADEDEDAPWAEEFGPEDDDVSPVTLECIKVAIIGRPNVGKSTLLNTLTGEQRALTSPIAGTTRDSLDLKIRRDGQEYLLIDTAGLRKKAKVSDRVERYSTLRSLAAIAECDVAVVLIDASKGPTDQDAKIVGLAHEQGKGIVIALNKWDLVTKTHRSVQEFKDKMNEAFKFSPYAPVLFISAITGKRCPKVIETVRDVAYERAKRVKTSELNYVLKRAAGRASGPHYRGRPIKLFFAAQVGTEPPRIALFFNYPRHVHFSYLRFLKNAIRDRFGFHGTDIKLMCRSRHPESRRSK